jgi:hypothetical protein
MRHTACRTIILTLTGGAFLLVAGCVQVEHDPRYLASDSSMKSDTRQQTQWHTDDGQPATPAPTPAEPAGK